MRPTNENSLEDGDPSLRAACRCGAEDELRAGSRRASNGLEPRDGSGSYRRPSMSTPPWRNHRGTSARSEQQERAVVLRLDVTGAPTSTRLTTGPYAIPMDLGTDAPRPPTRQADAARLPGHRPARALRRPCRRDARPVGARPGCGAPLPARHSTGEEAPCPVYSKRSNQPPGGLPCPFSLPTVPLFFSLQSTISVVVAGALPGVRSR